MVHESSGPLYLRIMTIALVSLARNGTPWMASGAMLDIGRTSRAVISVVTGNVMTHFAMARFNASLSIFTSVIIALIAFLSLTRSGSVTIWMSNLGSICHETPNLSVSQPQACG